MVILMEMSSGRACGNDFGCYGRMCGGDVSNASGAEVPRIEARLEEVVVAAHRKPAIAGIAGFMAHRYLDQE